MVLKIVLMVVTITSHISHNLKAMIVLVFGGGGLIDDQETINNDQKDNDGKNDNTNIQSPSQG
eukprot:2325240-Ditylum_brightwellii.AAC.1